MLCLFFGPTHKDSVDRHLSIGFEVTVTDPASYYPKTPEALLFRPPPKFSPNREGLSSVGNNVEKRCWKYYLGLGLAA